MSLKAKIESILFLSDKPMRAQAISTLIGEDLQVVRQILLELIHEFEERGGGLEIADEDGYAFRVKEEYASLMNEFLPVEITAAELRTLSAIAIKQPIPQSEIIRIRGAGAYEHIRELVIKDLVSRKDDGRSPMLATTKRFQEYFRLSKDGKSLRQYLKRQMKKRDKEELESEKIEQLELFVPGTELGLESFAPPGQISIDNLGELEVPPAPPLPDAPLVDLSSLPAPELVDDIPADNVTAEVDLSEQTSSGTTGETIG